MINNPKMIPKLKLKALVAPNGMSFLIGNIFGNVVKHKLLETVSEIYPLEASENSVYFQFKTAEKDLQEFLAKKFTSVQCEKLISTYSISYSSFKMIIPRSEYDKVLNETNWSKNIHRFFHPKRVKRPTE